MLTVEDGRRRSKAVEDGLSGRRRSKVCRKTFGRASLNDEKPVRA
jgi:hypothetical protein